jgi:hypothetical protein
MGKQETQWTPTGKRESEKPVRQWLHGIYKAMEGICAFVFHCKS